MARIGLGWQFWHCFHLKFDPTAGFSALVDKTPHLFGPSRAVLFAHLFYALSASLSPSFGPGLMDLPALHALAPPSGCVRNKWPDRGDRGRSTAPYLLLSSRPPDPTKRHGSRTALVTRSSAEGDGRLRGAPHHITWGW
jgi:hypothetical protein